jgi:hypothetical protein
VKKSFKIVDRTSGATVLQQQQKTLKLDEKLELQILEKLDITCNIHLYVIRVCDVRPCLNNLFNKYISFGQCNKNQSKIYQNFICGKTCAVTTVCTSLFFILDDWC